VVGRICLDYAMIDVTDIPGAAVGDEVTLLGAQGAAAITAEAVAGWLGTSAYEVLTTIVPTRR
jgi:alanine racemase